MEHLKCKLAVQVTAKENVFNIHDYGDWQLLVISASLFLTYLI